MCGKNIFVKSTVALVRISLFHHYFPYQDDMIRNDYKYRDIYEIVFPYKDWAPKNEAILSMTS